jgi:hypothetical protein
LDLGFFKLYLCLDYKNNHQYADGDLEVLFPLCMPLKMELCEIDVIILER